MSELIRLTDHRRQQRPVYFSRTELTQLLSLYSRRVMSGEWRDYAIDHRGGMAVFSVFRHSHESPLFAVAKCADRAARQAEFRLFSGPRRLGQTGELGELLKSLERQLKLVTS
jgi:hypothetical protein